MDIARLEVSVTSEVMHLSGELERQGNVYWDEELGASFL